jgi:hypothetical protein
MRILALVLIVLSAAADEAPLLIPLGSVDLAVQAGSAASAPLCQARHQRGLATLRERQEQPGPLEILVVVRADGGTVTVTVHQATDRAAPLLSAIVPAGDALLRLVPPVAADLVFAATPETATPVRVSAQAYAGLVQPGILQALEGLPAAGGEGEAEEDAAAAADPALAPFRAEARNLKQILIAMVAFQGDFDGAWPVAEGVTGVRMPPQTPEEARLLTAASLELLALHTQLPSQLFVSPFNPDRRLPAARPRAEILARPDPAWAEDIAYDWSLPDEVASFRVVLASRRFVEHPTAGLGVTAAFSDSTTRFLRVAREVEVQGMSTAGLSGFGDDLLPAVPNGDAAGAGDGDDAQPSPTPDNIFDDHADGEPGCALLPGRGDERRAFVK